MSLFVLIALHLIVFLANTVEALVGFGSTILTLTFAGFFIPLENLINILVPLNLLLSLVICLKEWRQIHFRLFFSKILPLSLLGMPIGIWAYQNIQGNLLKLLFGIAILWIGVRALRQIYRRTNTQQASFTKWNELYLILGGILQGL